MKISTTETIAGCKIIETVGIAKGTVVQSKNIGRDILAGFKTIVGGEIAGYTDMLRQAREIATERMIEDAKKNECRCHCFCKIWFIFRNGWISRNYCLWNSSKN